MKTSMNTKINLKQPQANHNRAASEKNNAQTGMGKRLFVILGMASLSIPLLLFPVFGRQGAESDASVTRLPKPGIHLLSDLGDYFSDNFAFRRQLVEGSARIKQTAFQTSSIPEKAVVGQSGWLFMADTLDDYFGKRTLSDSALSGISYNLSILQEQLAADGKDFLFLIAPNKNSIYPQFMPSRMLCQQSHGNAAFLMEKIQEQKIHTIDLYGLFRNDPEIRYHKTDSHWTAYGAAMAADRIFSALGKEHTDFTKLPYTQAQDFSGDVYRMLYPDSTCNDWEVHFDQPFTYDYVTRIKSTFDPEIETRNNAKEGGAFVLRDSFGNALLPFIAEEYGSAYFTRDALYPIYKAYERGDDTVIFEIVERHLSYLQSHAPVLAMREVSEEIALESLPESSPLPGDSLSIEQDPNSGLLQVSGSMDTARLSENGRYYICFLGEDGQPLIFPAFRGGVRGLENPDCGICTYIDLNQLDYGDYGVYILSGQSGELALSGCLEEFSVE